jgi:hypothetical protein
MTKLIPDPKAPNRSADYIYGERMEPFEERMNFFLNEKPETKKDNVKEEDKTEVDGLESIIKSFSCLSVKPVEFIEETSVDGLEAANKGRKFIDFLIQLAKDAVEFIMNLINNRISRVTNKEARIAFERKRNGIQNEPVKYPAGVRRLLHPLKVSSDPNWVNSVLKEVDDFYNDTIKTYKLLTGKIKETNTPGFNLESAISDTIKDASKQLSMKQSGETYQSEVLPGNKRLVLNDVKNGDTSQIGIYFSASTIETKLKEPEFQPTSFMIDDTLSTIKKLVNNIKSNQSTISQLYRAFEKETKSFQNNTAGLTTEQRDYLNWLIRFNKRLMSATIQYVLSCLDTGLDFINAGLKDG